MVSRKRSKGKERKAKKVEKESNKVEFDKTMAMATRALIWSRYDRERRE